MTIFSGFVFILKCFIYNLAPPYLRHIHKAHKVYNSIVKDLTDTENRIHLTLDKNRCKIKRGEKIRVAFLHMYATEIQDLNLFEMMLESPYFDPYFIVIPVLFGDQQHLGFNYKRTLKELAGRYGNDRVLNGYHLETQECIDYTDQFELASTNTPYDGLTKECFRSRYWTSKGIPVVYIPYLYMGLSYVTRENLKRIDYNFFWKVYVSNRYTKLLAKEYMANKGKNIIVTGYPKFDNLSKITPSPHKRKVIVIAPHHQIGDHELGRGGFRQYAGFLQGLPSRYPHIEFIFRPHPQLFETLKKFWSTEEIDDWLTRFTLNENVTYSTEGDYIKTLADSDALIHDCDSFVAEYFYFNKPCAFIRRKGLNYKKIQLRLGLQCLKEHYLIKKEEDWYHFIEDVVLNGKDVRKDRREAFAKKHIMINYPHATKAIYDNIVAELVELK